VCSVILQTDFPRGLYALLDEDDSHHDVACLLTFEESREMALTVMAMYGPYGSVRMDNWCTVCNGYNTCVGKPCSKLNGRCLLCGLSTHTSATCPNRNSHPNPEERLNVPSGFCYHCLLPLFIVGGVRLHSVNFTAQNCDLRTGMKQLLADGSKLPERVRCMPIKERFSWAFAGRRVPNLVRLLSHIKPE
jgi:hypothetical protein